MMHLDQSILLLYQTYKNLYEKVNWINDSVIDQNFNISKYNIMARNSYINLPNELSHVKQVLINIQNIILH